MIPGLASFGFVVVTPFILIALPIVISVGLGLSVIPSVPGVGVHHILAFAAGLLLLMVVVGCSLFFAALIISHLFFKR